MDSPSFAVRIPPLAVAAFTGALAWLGSLAFPTLTIGARAPRWMLAALIVAGLGSSVAGLLSFWRARTTVNPMTPGAVTTLVRTGVYRFTRNPMYLGFLLLLTAWGAWLAHPLAFCALPAFVVYFNRVHIRREEAALHSRFGSAFVTYQAQVRRWI